VQSDPPQAWAADFELSGTAQSGRLKLSGPLGIQLADLTWSPLGAQLSARGETRSYASLDELASQMSEHALPVEALFGWLNGRTQAIAGWDVQLEPGQRLVARRTEPLPTAELRVIWVSMERNAP
jgi:outer membrane lipoprotein LolB